MLLLFVFATSLSAQKEHPFKQSETNAYKIENSIIVRDSSDFDNVDSDKVYLIDGFIEMGTYTILVPVGGIEITGLNVDVSGFTSSSPNAVLFSSPPGGSGNVFMDNLSIEYTGAGSQVYNLTASASFPAVEVRNLNYNNCQILGEITGYRQGLEVNTGRFGGTPDLTLSGSWAGGFLINTSIVRGLTDGAYALFEAGTGFSMNSRFKTNMNADLNASVALVDFSASNFPSANTLQLDGTIISRLGVTDASDATITPNIQESELPSFWKNNVGIPNTYVGIEGVVSTESTTVISTIGAFVDLEGTFTASKIAHYTLLNTNQFTALAGSPHELRASVNMVIDGSANNQVSIKLVVWDDSAGAFIDYKTQTRNINNLQGGNDVAYFNFSDHVILDVNDYVKVVVANDTSTDNITALAGSEITIEEL
jgi:hypothetical protein